MHNVGLKMREWRFRDYWARKFPIGGGAMSLTPLPPSPRESATLVHIFCLTGREWSLTCWAKIWGEHWSCPVETAQFVPWEKILFWWYNKSFINSQACSVNMDECLPCSFLHFTSSYPTKVSGKKNLSIIQPSCLFRAFSVGTYCAQVTYFIFIALDNVLYMYM